ncbi:hypothetical protein, partial [Neisseria meningitidis]|uniref:hypothetical protein n=1 Tax=Neisseria meningitidis TaxID=487 RepID=UPI001E62BD6B
LLEKAETAPPSFPRKWESRNLMIAALAKTPKPNGLDSRLRGNDESIRTETCTASFPRKWESSFLSFSHSR